MMNQERARRSRSEKAFLAIVVIGLLIVAAYYIMDVFSIGKIGDPTDIGGGMMAMAGYFITTVGAIGLVLSVAFGRLRRSSVSRRRRGDGSSAS